MNTCFQDNSNVNTTVSSDYSSSVDSTIWIAFIYMNTFFGDNSDVNAAVSAKRCEKTKLDPSPSRLGGEEEETN